VQDAPGACEDALVPTVRQVPRASVVIPAHDEERTIARTLRVLLADAAPGEFDVVVVCNGCTDATAARARESAPEARVLEIATASKSAATAEGNASTTAFPRVHLDADVEIRTEDVRALVGALGDAVLATGPRRVVPRDGCSWPVRYYYDVWEQLPRVRSGLFGRGVIAVSKEGQARVDLLPQVMSDDLAVSDAFATGEFVIVDDACVVVRPPRTTADLLRRRVRVATGVAQADALGVRAARSGTSIRVLARLGLRTPALLPRVLVFLAVAAEARRRARAAIRVGDFTSWARDESSRAVGG
jgi:hypothetical protein